MAKAPKRIYAGLKIHNWEIVARMPEDKKTPSPNLRRRVKIRCVCGQVETIPLYYLIRSNPKKHCGCLNKGLASRHNLEYRVWYMMYVRCYNKDHRSYKDYGGRGIYVCDRWIRSNPHGFANFLHDMGPRKTTNLTLERLDVNGPYAPEYNGKRQCVWATWTEQNANKRMHLLPPPEESPEDLAEIPTPEPPDVEEETQDGETTET